MTVFSIQLRATILILFVVLIRSLFLYKLPKKIFLGMWALVFTRLLIPYIGTVAAGFTLPDFEHVLFSFLHTASGTTASAQPGITFSAYSIPWFLRAVWLAGVLLLAAFFAVGHIRGRRVYRFASPVEAQNVLEWKQQNKIRRNVRVLKCTELTSALTYGVFRPVILLPASTDFENQERLRSVLSHEMEHIRHLDVLVKWISTIILCLNWYNPMIWVMHILMNRDMELHCDACVLKRLGISRRTKSEYAMALITLAEEKKAVFPLANHFSRSAMEERILSIMHGGYASAVFIGLAVLGIVVLVLLSFVTFVTGTSEVAFTIPL